MASVNHRIAESAAVLRWIAVHALAYPFDRLDFALRKDLNAHDSDRNP